MRPTSLFWTDYWAVVSNATGKRALGSDDIQQADVVRAVELALRRQKEGVAGPSKDRTTSKSRQRSDEYFVPGDRESIS